MKNWIIVAGIAGLMSLQACDNEDKINGRIILDSEFETNAEEWMGGFAEYEAATDTATLEMRFGRTLLPAVIDTTRYGLRIQSHNRSDDMFMFVKKKVTGLRPGTTYQVSFDIQVATPFTDKGVGAGGSSGGATHMKAGASFQEPVVKLENGRYTINIDKGNQSEGGKEMVILGNISNGLDQDGYALVSRSNGSNPVAVTADASGSIWLCVGTDSGFEGRTILYYDRIKATITQQN